MAATYLLRAIKAGFAAFAFTDASRSMPPWGAKEPLFGTSPFAVGIPGGEKGDFVLDISPSVAARGKIRKAARRGEKIPEGYALDEEGGQQRMLRLRWKVLFCQLVGRKVLELR